MKGVRLARVLAAVPEASRPLLQAVVDAAEAADVGVLLVGGPVRDLLLGRPVRDVDLVVEPTGEHDAEALARAAAPPDAKVVAHGRFGTVVLEHAQARIDLATARSERYAHPGALPEVAPGSLEEDLARRDFSVNAMAIGLSPRSRAGRPSLIDPSDGRSDLEAGALRVLHRASFLDDPTRALRAARLAPRLGFSLTRSSRAALRDALRQGAFGAVSGDRIRREIEKLFEDARNDLAPLTAFRRLVEWDVMPALEPGLGLPAGAAAPLRALGRVLQQPAWPPERRRPWVSGLAVWLAAVPTGLRARTLRRLSVQGEAARRVAGFGRLRTRLLRELGRVRGRGAVDALLTPLADEELLALYASAPARLRQRIARFASDDRHRRTPLDGRDLVAAGIAGPAVGRALGRIRAAFLDGEIDSREEALVLAAELARRRSRRTR